MVRKSLGVLLACSTFALACGDAVPRATADAADVETAVDAGYTTPPCSDAGAPGAGAFDMLSPEEALEAYARLRSESCSTTVQLTRRGKPLTIEYSIK